MRGQQIRQALRSGKRVYGTHIASLMNPMCTAMAADMEIDFAFICTEHMPIDRTEVGMMCRYYAARGISPIVRVPSTDPTAIACAMDGGADGIVVPYVETEQQVRDIVGAVKYRPLKGIKLEQVLQGHEELPSKTVSFLNHFNRDNYIIIGVESVHAIQNLEKLIHIEGVDGVFLGPHDITVSMDIPGEYEHPEFIDTLETVVTKCRHAGVGVGLHTLYLNMRREHLLRLLDAGMNWIINGADITVMIHAMNNQLRAIRELAGDTPYQQMNDADHCVPVESCIT